MNKRCLIFILAAYCAAKSNGQETNYSSAQIKADIQFLQSKLVGHHPNLYLYTSKKETDVFFDSLYQNIPVNMTDEEAYRYITPVCSKIKDGHTLFFPSDKTISYDNAHAYYFPFKVYWNGEKMYVELNYSQKDEIENGAEITSINGISTPAIMAYCLARLMRDGENRTYPIWILNNWFNEYYGYFYGHPTEYTIKYGLPGQPVQTKLVKALRKQDILDNRAKRYPTRSFSRTFDQKAGNGIVLDLDRELKIAKLTIRDFTNSILKKT